VRFLSVRLESVRAIDEDMVKGLMRDLGNDKFTVRRDAMKRLGELRELAEPALRKGLEGPVSAESARSIQQLLEQRATARSPEDLRMRRAIEVLENIGTG